MFPGPTSTLVKFEIVIIGNIFLPLLSCFLVFSNYLPRSCFLPSTFSIFIGCGLKSLLLEAIPPERWLTPKIALSTFRAIREAWSTFAGSQFNTFSRTSVLVQQWICRVFRLHLFSELLSPSSRIHSNARRHLIAW